MDHRRPSNEEYADLLAKVDLLASLDRVTLAKLSANLEPVSLKSGDILFHQGEPGDAFYIVSKGSLALFIHRKEEAEKYRVKTLYPGDHIGEISLLTNEVRASTVQAEVNSEVLRLDRVYFLDLVNKEPSVALAAAASSSRKLTKMLQFSLQGEAGTDVINHVEAVTPRQSEGSTFLDWLNNRLTLTSLFAFFILFLTWNSTPPANLSVGGWHLLITLFAFLPAIVLDVLPEGVLSLIIIASWFFGGVAPTKVILSGYGSASWILVVAITLVGNGMASSGILYRLVLWTAEKTGGSYPLTILGLMFSGLLISPAVPSSTTRMIFVAPLITDLVDALNLRPKSRASAGLSMAAFTFFGQMVATTLTSSTTALLVYSILPETSEAILSWLSWVKFAAPMNFIIIFGLLASIFFIYRQEKETTEELPKKIDREESFKLQKAILGKITPKEWCAMIVGVCLLFGFVFEPIHGIPPAWVAIIAMAILASARLVTEETVRSINWSFILLFGMLNSLVDLFSYTGLNGWLSVLIGDYVKNFTEDSAIFLILFTILCYFVSMIVRWSAAAPLMTIALGPVGASMGIDPLIVGIISVAACNIFFQPYQSNMYLAFYQGTAGRLFTHSQARPMAFAYSAFTLLGVIFSIPFWRAMGLM